MLEEGSGVVAPDNKPSCQRMWIAVRNVDKTGFVALAVANSGRPGLFIYVGTVQRDSFTPPQPASIQHTQDKRITYAGRGHIAADSEDSYQLPDG